MPIFHEIMKKDNRLQFHVMQFTWAGQEKTDRVKKAAEDLGIIYNHVPIIKKPVASIGSLVSLLMGSQQIKNYIRQNHIDIVMPRSTFPAFMVNRIRNRNFKVVFDADGLPIDERVDFAGLKKDGVMYRWLKAIEKKALLNSDRVITRSQKSIEVHLQQIGEQHRQKFSIVINGRETRQFVVDQNFRQQAREQLGVEDYFVWIYAGSLGNQYCWDEMLHLFELSQGLMPSKFLILTGDTGFAYKNMPEHLKEHLIIRTVPFENIPFFLNVGDAAFALRKPTFSMQGVAPIKLGEYLLTGIPTIASKGIGDADVILKSFEDCFVFDHDKKQEEQDERIKQWIGNIKTINRESIREKALRFFSIERAGESYLDAIKPIL